RRAGSSPGTAVGWATWVELGWLLSRPQGASPSPSHAAWTPSRAGQVAMGGRAKIFAVMAALVLAPAVAHADYPHGPGLASQENPQLGPVEVCNEMLAASR